MLIDTPYSENQKTIRDGYRQWQAVSCCVIFLNITTIFGFVNVRCLDHVRNRHIIDR